MENQLSELAAISNASIQLYHSRYDVGTWDCTCEATHEGVSIKVLGKAKTPAEAVANCHQKFFKLVRQGEPALTQPVLEYQPEQSPPDF